MTDDHSRIVHSQSHDNETAPTAAKILRPGLTVKRVLSDNDSAYKPRS